MSKLFHPIKDVPSSIFHDHKNPEQFYSLADSEIERLTKESEIKEINDGRWFPHLPDDYTVKVRMYKPDASGKNYYEDDKFIDFPANRLVPDWAELR